MTKSAQPSRPTSPAIEVFALFLRLGFTAFGGPAAHISIMHDEVVERRKWLSHQEFLDLLGATNLIPGPNSTEMAIHIGYRRAGWPGLVLGGLGFILPAMLIVLALAWLYVRFGTLPQAGWLLYGIKPVVIAIIMQALWRLAPHGAPGPGQAHRWRLAVLVLYFLGVNELALLFGGGLLLHAGGELLPPAPDELRQRCWLPLGGLATLTECRGCACSPATPFSLPVLFLTFLKIGAVLYGSGYVLLAFLNAEFVERLGWLTESQLLDAIAIGQVTPGPLFTSATFIGYQLGGVPGALLATLGIFLPSFIFVRDLQPVHPAHAQLALAGRPAGWRQRRGFRPDRRGDLGDRARFAGRRAERAHRPGRAGAAAALQGQLDLADRRRGAGGADFEDMVGQAVPLLKPSSIINSSTIQKRAWIICS